MTPRTSQVERTTKETSIRAVLNIDGSGETRIATGIGFLDHLLTALCKHARFDLELEAEGDLHIDDHHTAEDCAIVLGSALDRALGDRQGIQRFAHAYAPLDEALCRAVVDLSGRPWPQVDIPFTWPTLGTLATENIRHVLNTIAIGARMNLHVDLIRGDNDHHKAEAAFKATALALREAVRITNPGVIASTKGVLT